METTTRFASCRRQAQLLRNCYRRNLLHFPISCLDHCDRDHRNCDIADAQKLRRAVKVER